MSGDNKNAGNFSFNNSPSGGNNSNNFRPNSDNQGGIDNVFENQISNNLNNSFKNQNLNKLDIEEEFSSLNNKREALSENLFEGEKTEVEHNKSMKETYGDVHNFMDSMSDLVLINLYYNSILSK